MPQKNRICAGCGTGIYRDNIHGRCLACHLGRNFGVGGTAQPVPQQPVVIAPPPIPADQLRADRDKARVASDLSDLRKKYAEALKTIEGQEKRLRFTDALDTVTPEPLSITPLLPSNQGEGVAVAVLSDWHSEERVGAEIGGLNVYNPDVCATRAVRLFQGILRLLQLHQAQLTINTLLLPLLGDFITNDIHEAENAEVNALLPMHALTTVQNHLIGGIEFLLANTTVNIVLDCHSGNHSRTTHKTRFTTENGHSLEYLMYLHLAAYFRHEPRVTFRIADGMHSYVDVFGVTLRMHHGHAIKYGGGVGGIYIPTNKAIAQWNKGRHADIDVFGHFHQLIYAPNFVCNGSLIGYNAFALSIKADYEPPRQAFFIIDKKRKRTAMWPVCVS